MIVTADHDDRVFPAHSFKFAAALQAAQGGSAPVLIRIETKAGHGAGKPTSKVIDEAADRFAFLVKVLDVPVWKTTSSNGFVGPRNTWMDWLTLITLNGLHGQALTRQQTLLAMNLERRTAS